MAALVASLLICSMVLGGHASPVTPGPRLLEKRDDGRNDGLLRMELVPSLHSESTRSLMALGKFISTDIDLDQFMAANLGAASTDSSSNTTLPSDAVIQQLNLFKTVITQFNSPLQVGSPFQTLNVLFDTGSFNLWLRGKACQTNACVGAPAFDSSASSTYKTSNKRAAELTYADGTVVSGIVSADVFAVGAAKVSNFQFTLADNVTTDMPENEKDYDGIVGMSLTPADSRLGAYPIFFNSLYQAKAISKPQFSYYITPGDAGGQVIFGGYDKSLMANPDDTITWVSVVDDTYMDNVNDLTFRAEGAWALPITRISSTIDGLSYSFPAKSGVIMDTGTSLGVIPATFLKRMVGLMRARKEGGSYIVPCSAKSATGGPVLFFSVGNNVTLSLTADDYVVPVPFKTTSGSIVTLCIIGFEEVADNLGYSLLGNTMLKRYLTIFDYTTANIGFAFAKGRQPVFGGGASINGTGTGNVLSVTLPASGSSPSPSSSRKMYMSPSVKGAAMVVGILTLASSIGSL